MLALLLLLLFLSTTTTTTNTTTNNTINNNNNNHCNRGHTVLPSAWVFIRYQAIPPLRGGAGQALPNLQTTPRDHPHPASRPMTLGHFTSWRADDRGYYTGVGYTPAELDHSFGAPMCPAWCNCDIQYMIQRDRKRDREQSERERERSWSHFWGNFLGRCGNTHIHLLHLMPLVYT